MLTTKQEKEIELVELIKFDKSENNFARVKKLLDEGVDPNSLSINAGHSPALYIAVIHSNANIVEELLKHGANPDSCQYNQKDRQTCLQVAMSVPVKDKDRKIALLQNYQKQKANL
jgi:hypothetical protein